MRISYLRMELPRQVHSYKINQPSEILFPDGLVMELWLRHQKYFRTLVARNTHIQLGARKSGVRNAITIDAFGRSGLEDNHMLFSFLATQPNAVVAPVHPPRGKRKE